MPLNTQLSRNEGAARVLINCASNEYFKSVKPKLLDAPVVTPVFEDWKGGRYKIISFHAKRARGLIARYAVEQRIASPHALKDFDAEGYAFDARRIERLHLRFSPSRGQLTPRRKTAAGRHHDAFDY